MSRNTIIATLVVGAVLLGLAIWPREQDERAPGDSREEVVFWHFWGGEDLKVVESLVERFNESQDVYRVRAISMPGNNLQAKLFLSIAGGSPPDLVNQDDPILANWHRRNLITPIAEFVDPAEVAELNAFLVPAALKISQVNGELMAVCNGLDIRALYYNQTFLEQRQFAVPSSLEQFDQLIEQISPSGTERDREYYAFLPDNRRLWVWSVVFGGELESPLSHQSESPTGKLTQIQLHDPRTIQALAWMQSFTSRYGWDNIAAFRQSDQSLPGKAFPLLPLETDRDVGRYVFVMDGQWRVRDIERYSSAARQAKRPAVEFGVCPLPFPEGGRENAGWVNGNFFVVPRGARNPAGAWAFMKFWIGMHDPQQAARTCAAGGWIPVSSQVAETPLYQAYLAEHPLMNTFLKLANSPNQIPIPADVHADQIKRKLDQGVYRVLSDPRMDPAGFLLELQEQIVTMEDE